MKEGKGPRKKIKIPKIKIPTIKVPSINKVKLILALVMLVAEIIAMIGSSIYGFQVGAVTLILFAVITFDYIRVLRREEKEGPWYELENMEKK